MTDWQKTIDSWLKVIFSREMAVFVILLAMTALLQPSPIIALTGGWIAGSLMTQFRIDKFIKKYLEDVK